MRIAIIHDYIDKRGGGERLVLNLAKALDADIYTVFVDYDKTFEDAKNVRIIQIGSIKKVPAPITRSKLWKVFENYKFPKYDFYIFSGVWCISAAKLLHPNLLYLHTPPRHLYDLKDYNISKMKPIQKQLAKILIKKWTQKDQAYIKNIDKLCTNSRNVKERVKKYYGEELYKKTTVVYTGFDTKKYKWKKDKNFFLSPHRLDHLKRIDIIIEAFKKMPGKNIIIAGSGPDKERLIKIAGGCENISFLGSIDEQTMISLYSTCIATISANVDEDLGLVPLETHASGKPSIVVSEGAFLETVNKTNGVFFDPNPESLIKAIHECEAKKWNHRRIQQTARKYDIKNFVKRIKEEMQLLI